MRKRLVRGYASASLALVTAGLLASCSAGVDAGTLDPQRLSGAHVDVGSIKIRNALVVAPDAAGDEAQLVMTVVNDGATDDALTGVTIAGPDGDIPVDVRPGTIDLPAETPTIIPGDNRPSVTMDSDTVPAGTYVTATFSFETAGIKAVRLLVLSEAAVYGGN